MASEPLIVRWALRGSSMRRAPKGPWILVSVFEHYKNRTTKALQRLEKERDELQKELTRLTGESSNIP